MHLQWFEAGALGTNAIVGGGVPMAAGNAWAQQHLRRHRRTDLTVTYFGDGAANIGSVLESLNLASAWKLPVCFFIENNGYAVSTTVEEATGEPRLSARGPRLRHHRPGGSTAWTRSRCTWSMERGRGAAPRRRGPGRRRGARSTGSSTRTARTRAPRSATGPRRRKPTWRARDPLDRVAREMTRLGLIDEAGVAAVRAQAPRRCGRRPARSSSPTRDGQAGQAAHPPRAVARPGVRQRRGPRRPARARRGADRRARVVHRRAAAREVHRRGRRR